MTDVVASEAAPLLPTGSRLGCTPSDARTITPAGSDVAVMFNLKHRMARAISCHCYYWLGLLLVLGSCGAQSSRGVVEALATPLYTRGGPEGQRSQSSNAFATAATHSPSPSIAPRRTKRWTTTSVADEVAQTPPSRQQQQTTIPAANPNFEAAFQGECGKNNNSNPCEHICLDLHDGTYECSCFYGFTLAVDGYSCAPVAVAAAAAASAAASTTLPPPPKLAPRAPFTLAPEPGQQPQRWSGAPGERQSAWGAVDLSSRLGGELEVAAESGSRDRNKGAGRAVLSDGSISESRHGSRGTNEAANAAAEGPVETKDAALIASKRANDNRKLVDELARGAKLASNENFTEATANVSGGGSGNAAGSRDEDTASAEVRRRQRRLPLGAAAWIYRVAANIGTSNSSIPDSNDAIAAATTTTSNHPPRPTAAAELAERRLETSTPPPQPPLLSPTLLPTLGDDDNDGEEEEEQEENEEEEEEQQEKRTALASVVVREPSLGREQEANLVMLRPQMTPAIAGSSGQPDDLKANNKGLAGDKWVSYDVVTRGDETSANNQNASQDRYEAAAVSGSGSSGGKLMLIETSLAFEDVDPDIRSIMSNNDRLAKQLELSILSTTNEAESPFEGPAHLEDVNSGDDDTDDNHGPNDSQRGLGPELNLLDELVAETIEDYARQQRSRQQQPGQSEQEQPQTRRREMNEINGPFSELQLNRSSAGGGRRARRRATAHRRVGGGADRNEDRNGHDNNINNSSAATDSMVARLPPSQEGEGEEAVEGVDEEDDNDNLLCSRRRASSDKLPQAVYRDCSELPECESGGQCIVETKWISSRHQRQRGHRRSPDLKPSRRLESRARCQCPVGRGGHLCQRPIQRSIPKFAGQSYLALPMIADSQLTNLRLVFKPEPSRRLSRAEEEEESSAAEAESRERQQQSKQANAASNSGSSLLLLSARRFVLLLTDDMSQVELRYPSDDNGDGSGGGSQVTRVIGSRDVEPGRWNELVVTDGSSDSSQPEELISRPGRIVLVTPARLRLDLPAAAAGSGGSNSGELFVAGLPDASQPASALGSPMFIDQGKQMVSGFVGCIKELRINGRAYNFRSDLNGDTLDGFDIDECDSCR